MIAVYDKATGVILRTVRCPDADIEHYRSATEEVLEIGDDVRDDTHVVDVKTKRCVRRAQPAMSQVSDAMIARFDCEQMLAAEFSRRNAALVQYDGHSFDANSAARNNITQMLTHIERFGTLPAAWAGWRTNSNDMVWATDTRDGVRAHLANLLSLIENREQALRVAMWRHKDAIRDMTDATTVREYGKSMTWPS